MCVPFSTKFQPAAAATGPAVETLVAGNTAFALDLFHGEKKTGPNIFFSPYSISAALGMTYAGARGRTEQEMARTLHFSQSPANLPRAYSILNLRFQQIERGTNVSLGVANSLWCERDYHFLPSFLALNRDYFQAEVRSVDFSSDSDGVRKEINSWVAQHTRDRIQDLLQPGQVRADTRLLLCNAIYFKGDWAAKFDPKATKPEPFFVSADRSVTVPMMSRHLKLRSRALQGFAMVSLPYAGDDLAMVVLLPDAKDGLGELEQRLTADALQEWLSGLKQAPQLEALVALPKFKLNCRLDLARTLAAMGMPAAFSPGEADFSGMTGSRDLFVSDVVHQAYVDVNEEGTEAAAATGVGMRLASLSRPLVFRADHPFLFLIVEQQTGSILFLGRVGDPSQ